MLPWPLHKEKITNFHNSTSLKSKCIKSSKLSPLAPYCHSSSWTPKANSPLSHFLPGYNWLSLLSETITAVST